MPRGDIVQVIRVPNLGERDDLPDPEMPITALRFCQNMIRNAKGLLVIRPGYKQIVLTGPGGRIMGIFYFTTSTSADRTVVANLTQMWQFNGTIWVNITGASALTGNTTNIVRMTIFPQSGVYNLLAVNNVNTPKVWDGTAATYSDLGGAPPIAKDITTAANRVILLISPNTIRVSDFNNMASWPATLSADLVDTGDPLTCLERLGRVSFAIYGDKSQWVGKGQLGSFPFRFDLVDEQPGPISPGVVVKDGQVHYYLGLDGNVYRFDGIRAQRVGNALQPYINANLNFINRGMSHALLLSDLRVIFFFFPTSGQSAPDGGVAFNVDTGEMFRLKFGAAITASARWRAASLINWLSLSGTWLTLGQTYPTWVSMGSTGVMSNLLGDNLGQVHQLGFGSGSDNGTLINAIWDLALMNPAGDDQNTRASTFETFFRKTANPTTVTVSLGTSDTLMSDPTFVIAQNTDISVDQRNEVDLEALDKEARWLTIRHDVSTANGNVSWIRGVFFGQPSRPA